MTVTTLPVGGSSSPSTVDDTVRTVVRMLVAMRRADIADVARHIGISRASFYAKLNNTGKAGPFRVAEVAGIAEYFGVRLPAIFEGPGAWLGAVPEAVAGGRAVGDGESQYSRSAAFGEVDPRVTNACLLNASEPRSNDRNVVSLAGYLARRPGAAA